MHEYNECWLYWSFMETEPDPRVKATYELHLNMEIEHLRIAVELMKQVEDRDAAEFLPKALEQPMLFQENKAYVRKVLAEQIELTSRETEFVPVAKLPEDHRFFDYQAIVNEGGVPSEQVIEQARKQLGEDYRLQTEGAHPVPGLKSEKDRKGASTDYATRLAA